MTQAALKLNASHHQTMTPRLQHAVRMLQLSSQDYEQELQTMATKNPFLEMGERAITQEHTPKSLPLDSFATADTSAADVAPQAPEYAEQPVSRGDTPSDIGQTPDSVQSGGTGSSLSAIEAMVADIDLRQHLHSQANLLPLSERDHVLVCTVIESLDDDGYLRCDLEELASLACLSPPADQCEMRMVLKLVQSFEPSGVGARNVIECLLLQIEDIQGCGREIMRRIVTDHLGLLARRDVASLSRLLQCPSEEIQAACNALRRLDPHPGWRYGRAVVQFLKPDVIARKVNGTWTAQLNPAVVPAISLNQTYAGLFLQHREKKHSELGAELQEAKWAVRNVTQRFTTILAMANAIVGRQWQFLEHGPLAMRPLALRDIAQEIGVHESTVCRVSHNKYMSVAGRLIELKLFFARSMPMADSKTYSPTQIRALVQEMVAVENPLLPLSDVEIAKRLARQGLTVARRTVTKYRQLLDIPAVEHRRLINRP